MVDTVHRIWDFRGDAAGIIWFRKLAYGRFEVLRTYVNSGAPLAHYVSIAAAEPGSIDYVRPDSIAQNLSGESLFQAMQRFGLNPEVLPTAAWRSPQPFAEAA